MAQWLESGYEALNIMEVQATAMEEISHNETFREAGVMKR